MGEWKDGRGMRRRSKYSYNKKEGRMYWLFEILVGVRICDDTEI